jgi:L-rhamnose-H+ transport protein
MINSSVVGLGILLAAVSGLMNGTFTLPMRYLGRWSWENVWALFIVISCLVMPLIMVLATVTNPLQLLSVASPHQEAIALATRR